MMRFRKRPSVVALIAASGSAIVVLVFGAYAASSAPARGTGGSVSFWNEFAAAPQSTAMNQIVASVSKATGVDIKQRQLANNGYITSIRTSVAGGQEPDVLQYEGYQQTRDLAKAGKLLDITSFWNKHKSRFALSVAAKEACGYKGRIYCIPISMNSGDQMYYNANILKANGISPPTTWESFLAAAAKLKANGVTPISFGDKDLWPGSQWYGNLLVSRCGVNKVVAAEHGQGPKFTDPCFVQAATDLQGLATQGLLAPGVGSSDFAAGSTLFLAGKAAFFQTGDWEVASYSGSSKPSFKVGFTQFPQPKVGAHHGQILGGIATVIGLSPETKNRQAALSVLDGLTAKQPGLIWAKVGGQLALQKGAVEAGAPAGEKAIWANIRSATAVLPWLDLDTPPGVGEDAVYNGVQALLTGSTTPVAFSKSVQKAVDTANKKK